MAEGGSGDRGREVVAHHEPWPGQPFSEAVFNPLDQTILRHVNTPPPQAVVPKPAQPSTYYPGDDADLDDHLTLYDDSDNDTDVYDAPTLAPARAQSEARRAWRRPNWIA